MTSNLHDNGQVLFVLLCVAMKYDPLHLFKLPNLRLLNILICSDAVRKFTKAHCKVLKFPSHAAVIPVVNGICSDVA